MTPSLARRARRGAEACSRPRSPATRATPRSPAERRRSEGKPSQSWSGRRGSNPRPTAWKAVTLPLSYSRLRAARFASRSLSGGQAAAHRLSRSARLRKPARPKSSSCALPVASSAPRLPTEPRFARAKVGGEGRIRTFEAAGATDLQSVAFDRFATSPTYPPPVAPGLMLSSESGCAPSRFDKMLFALAILRSPRRDLALSASSWSWRRDLNPRPADYKSAALPD